MVAARGRDPLQGVGRTALGVAQVRATESAREDRLFHDPYAAAFVEAAPQALPEGPPTGEPASDLRATFARQAVLRTRFYDDYLLAACAAGCRQVVLLAAGLDTRAFRLAWPAGVRLFELDLPDVLGFKHAVLNGRGAAPRCERVALAADLTGDWPRLLAGAGHDPAAPTAWLAEGLLVYLSAADVEALLTGVTALSAPGSRIAFEHAAAARRPPAGPAPSMPTLRGYMSMWKGGLGDATPGRLASHGWTVQPHQRLAVAASYGRPLPESDDGQYLTAIRNG